MGPVALPDTDAERSTLFKGVNPEAGDAAKSTRRVAACACAIEVSERETTMIEKSKRFILSGLVVYRTNTTVFPCIKRLSF